MNSSLSYKVASAVWNRLSSICVFDLIWLSRHWACLGRGYWRYRSLIDWLIDNDNRWCHLGVIYRNRKRSTEKIRLGDWRWVLHHSNSSFCPLLEGWANSSLSLELWAKNYKTVNSTDPILSSSASHPAKQCVLTPPRLTKENTVLPSTHPPPRILYAGDS